MIRTIQIEMTISAPDTISPGVLFDLVQTYVERLGDGESLVTVESGSATFPKIKKGKP